MNTPLAGIQALELSTSVAEPTASMILADLGADVIKVESPAGGEDGSRTGATPWAVGCLEPRKTVPGLGHYPARRP